MKTVISWLLTVSLLLSVLVVGVSANGNVARQGDVNGDNLITTTDVRIVLMHILRKTALTPEQLALYDYDGDGVLNTTDTKQVLQRVVTPNSNVLKEIDLLAPTADAWLSPVQTTSGVPSIVAVTANAAGGQNFTNVGGTWPYAAYAYDQKVLVPGDATIEYDLTVNSSATSINVYINGSVPDLEGDKMMDDVAGRHYFKLNSYISTTNIDPGSGDLTKGTYKGSVRVSDIELPEACRGDKFLWISGLKVYAVGSNNTAVTIRTLKVTGYTDPLKAAVSTDPYEKIRTPLVDATETEGLSTLTGLELYENGERSLATTASVLKDVKKIYNTALYRRVVNYVDGYQIDIPFDWQEDFSLSDLRSRYTSDHYTLNVSFENQSPYGNTASGWNTYFTEWIARYIGNSSYMSANNLSYTRTPTTSTTILPGYAVSQYDIVINDNAAIDQPYYSIAVVRKSTDYVRFHLFVLKSDAPTAPVMEHLVRSFKAVAFSGRAVNSQGQYTPTLPTNWNAETKAYYNKLQTQNTTDWGFFSASMVPKTDSTYTSQNKKIDSEYERISKAIGADYGIMPTYSHLSYNGTYNQFPTDMANTYAGGNGFNFKPVLQFTYQFTNNNNSDLYAKTPMYDILRGKHDAQFRRLAKDIKAYGKPVLFRLNNEMNTDWTSYGGIVTLLDPDIFVMTWERLYRIFEEEGVDNCIWVFNPVANTTPYCGWGENLCYMPNEDTVHILGLTAYEFGNSSTFSSFKTLYTKLYQREANYYANMPWVISEFAAGAGGEKQFNWSTDQWDTTVKGRNADQQVAWINEMFECLNNRDQAANAFCKNIKGAVWFNVNDYTKIDGTNYILNYLALDETKTEALAAFQKGIYGQ